MLTKVRNKYAEWKKSREERRGMRKGLDRAAKLMSSKELAREMERMRAAEEKKMAEHAERVAREEARVKALLEGAPTVVEGGKYDEERAFYGAVNLEVRGAEFDGPADGESAFKETRALRVSDCFFNLRYPFWHAEEVRLSDSTLTDKCRAAFWYSRGVEATDCRLHGIKAFRECSRVLLKGCDISSPEFGWRTGKVVCEDSVAEGEYFFFEGRELQIDKLSFKGKYSFQYCEDAYISDSVLDTKDAFWHAKNVTVINSVIKGEYLGWYSENLTLINCKITGTQPFCYCKGLRLENCEMTDCDLSFERSEVNATVRSHVVSIKNPLSGYIKAPSVGEIILDSELYECEIEVEGESKCEIAR